MGETISYQQTEKERRKYARFETNLYITYALPGKGEKEAGVFITRNVSGGGFLFESLEEIAVGTLFDLWIHLPTSPVPLPAKGRVVRLQKTRTYGRYDVGMSLVEITEKERRELIKYLISTMMTKMDYRTLFI